MKDVADLRRWYGRLRPRAVGALSGQARAGEGYFLVILACTCGDICGSAAEAAYTLNTGYLPAREVLQQPLGSNSVERFKWPGRCKPWAIWSSHLDGSVWGRDQSWHWKHNSLLWALSSWGWRLRAARALYVKRIGDGSRFRDEALGSKRIGGIGPRCSGLQWRDSRDGLE